jgi:hypothetical protein
MVFVEVSMWSGGIGEVLGWCHLCKLVSKSVKWLRTACGNLSPQMSVLRELAFRPSLCQRQSFRLGTNLLRYSCSPWTDDYSLK